MRTNIFAGNSLERIAQDATTFLSETRNRVVKDFGLSSATTREGMTYHAVNLTYTEDPHDTRQVLVAYKLRHELLITKAVDEYLKSQRDRVIIDQIVRCQVVVPGTGEPVYHVLIYLQVER